MSAQSQSSDVLMPQLGETVAEGRISAWFRSVGDEVARGDNLFEIETDKVTMEVQAVEAGVLTEIRVPAGETVPVGAVVAVIDKGRAATPPARGNGPTREAKPAAASGGSSPFEAVRTPSPVPLGAKGPQGLKVTPLARRLIAEQGLDIDAIAAAVKAKGGWRIAAAAARAASASAPQARGPAAAQPAPGDRGEPLNRIRAATAKRLAENWRAIPHVFQAVEADFGRIDQARGAARAPFAERHGVALTYLPFIARAACMALADFPRVNAHFADDRLILHGSVHLGIAVDLGHEGLVVPVVRDAGAMPLTHLALAIAALVQTARAGKLTLDDMAGATYTLSNNGAFGTLFTTPIIDAPQVAILSIDAVRKRPVVVETPVGDAVMPRPVAMLGQSFDHRAFDGAYSAAFLARLKQIVETRDWTADLE